MPLAKIHQFLIYTLSFSVLKTFGWLCSLRLIPAYSIICYGRSFLVMFAELQKATIWFIMTLHPSVHTEQLGSHWTDFHELWYLSIFWKSVKTIQVSLKSDKNNGYFTWRPIISHSFLLRMKNVSDKICRINQNKHFMWITFFQNCAIYEIIRKNIVQWDRPQMTTWHMHIACWIPKATNTHSEYVLLIVFQLQQWFHKHASMLNYMYIGHLVDLCPLFQEYNYGVKQGLCVHLFTIKTEFTIRFYRDGTTHIFYY